MSSKDIGCALCSSDGLSHPSHRINVSDFYANIFFGYKNYELEEDPDKKCIITWNDYLGRIKYFMRGFIIIEEIRINISIKLDNTCFCKN
jgi:hypothetical protein